MKDKTIKHAKSVGGISIKEVRKILIKEYENIQKILDRVEREEIEGCLLSHCNLETISSCVFNKKNICNLAENSDCVFKIGKKCTFTA